MQKMSSLRSSRGVSPPPPPGGVGRGGGGPPPPPPPPPTTRTPPPPRGEIDRGARAGRPPVFVGVKPLREREGDPPQAAVGQSKQRRLGQLAQHYLKWKRLGEVSCRFDVVAVTLDARDRVTALRHLPAAFDVEAW